MNPKLFTIGHSTRGGPEFVALLKEHGVERLVDVRQFAGSRRYPQFGSAELAGRLAENGIAYEHLPGLGGRRQPKPDSLNTYWRHESFRAYADYMATPEFAAALAQLIDQVHRQPTAIMCAEAVPWRCHRQLISDALTDRGFEVLHILGTQRCDQHQLNPRAVRQPDGHLIYPAQETQRRLF